MRVLALITLVLLTLFGTTLFGTPLAKAEVVNFYAWGGSPQVNSYLRWAQQELKAEDIQLRHNKIADASEVVKQLINGYSNADIIWINGENFHALKKANALLPIVDDIKGMQHINPDLNWRTDFGESVNGLEVPWGLGQFNLIARPGVFETEAVSAHELMRAAQNYKGRISYPKPPEFHGTTFLKSLLLSLYPERRSVFQQPVASVNAEEIIQPLWNYLDKLHPLLWQQGSNFPSSAGEQVSYLANGQLVMAVSFNPNDYRTLVNQGRLPAGVKRYTLSDRAMTNTHYLAVPKTAQNPELAKQVIEFLLSVQAQLRKADTNRWGDPSVLAPQLLQTQEASQQTELLPSTDDFHASWQAYLEQQWSERYQ
ncbi:ABC transporter substrate-binding protein [Idiomarina piscisalsi]|uniref:ABC transporter substrate-binding protein n=1 Tax=Idiomarina piscisalsi TaxID=1096243 RepID=A0A432YHN6_9GAMM|nr:ABC transporter substrate-binding protein [Idiomarina piscisalsi]RUO60454.1 ABC transporter substrate-binding protein [Idiomarina piscisalsi]